MRLAAVLFAATKTFEPLVMNAVPTCAPASSPLAAPSRAQDGLRSDDSRKARMARKSLGVPSNTAGTPEASLGTYGISSARQGRI